MDQRFGERSIRWLFIPLLLVLVSCSLSGAPDESDSESNQQRPNILFAFADDWGVHAGAYGTKGIETPTFDRMAREGILFRNAFVAAPSCTPSRGAVLTGQHIWRLGPGANLHSTLPAELPVYPHLLKKRAGYFVGHTRKGWGPGNYRRGGRTKPPSGPPFISFVSFLEKRPEDQPFCFWFGSSDPHRGYSASLRKKMGVDPDDVTVPPYLPDRPVVRRDIANYYAEVQRFDREVGRLLGRLRDIGELRNTIVVISGDHGWPFPRGKSNLYDAGTHVPLVVHWPNGLSGERTVTDFVSLTDLAPTFLEAAGVNPPDDMTGNSLMPILTAAEEGRVQSARDAVITAKERHHGRCRKGNVGYPSRALRTDDFLYIRNDKPNRWPAGSPYFSSSQKTFSDTDDGPSKRFMIEHANQPGIQSKFKLAFGKRPREELYDLSEDPHQIKNVAGRDGYQEVLNRLSSRLENRLKAMDDPRETDRTPEFDEYPYYTGYGKKTVEPAEAVLEALELD